MDAKLEKNLYRISWPLFIEVLFFMLMGTLDTLMLSNYSDYAVASVGIANQILNVFGIILNVIATGITVVTAQFLGAKLMLKAKNTVKTGIIANFFIGVIAFLLLTYLGSYFLTWMKTDESIFGGALTYIRIVSISLMFVGIYQAMGAGFRSYSKPKIVMYTVGFSNLMNVVINYFLIYGKFGAPELGIAGAAIGTLVSRIAAMIILGIIMKPVLNINVLKLKINFESLVKMMKVGIPAATENLLWNISQIIIISFINLISVEALIARTYIYTMLQYVFIFSFAIAQGNSIIVGYFIGERDHSKALDRTFKSIKIAALFVAVLTIMINLFPREFLSLFTDNKEVIEIARSVIYIAFFIEMGRSMNLVFIFSLRAAGDTLFPVIMGVISMFGIAVGMSYVLGISLGLGVLGVFIASAADELFRGFFMLFRWKSKKWTKYADKMIET